jgi:ribosomal-protein-alanine N-acetyltransferase
MSLPSLVLLRKFWPHDLSEVFRITTDVFKETYLPNIFLELHARWPQGVMVIEDQGRVQGFIAGTMTSHTQARILLLGVVRGYRRRGFGSMLLKEFIREAERMGASAITLEVRVSNPKAIGFYRKHGFDITGLIPNYYNDGEDAFVMGRTIQWNI